MNDRSVYPLGKRTDAHRPRRDAARDAARFGQPDARRDGAAEDRRASSAGSGTTPGSSPPTSSARRSAIPLYGKLSDLYGRRPLFVAAISLFSAGSIVAGLAPSLEVLVAGRAIQGLGAGGLIPLGIAVIGDIIAPRERGKWQAVNGSVFAVSAVGGPFARRLDRRQRLLASRVLRQPPARRPRARRGLVRLRHAGGDARSGGSTGVGALLLTLGAGAGLVAASSGGVDYPWSSPVIVSLLVSSALLVTAFVAWERRVAEPLIPLALLRRRAIASADVALFALGAAAFGTITFVPLFVQGVLRESATSAGAVLTPLMLVVDRGEHRRRPDRVPDRPVATRPSRRPADHGGRLRAARDDGNRRLDRRRRSATSHRRRRGRTDDADARRRRPERGAA